MSDTPEKPKPTHTLLVRYTTGAESSHALRLTDLDTIVKGEHAGYDTFQEGSAGFMLYYATGGRTWIQRQYVLSYQLAPRREVKKTEDATIAAMRTSAERHRTAAQTPQEDVPDGLPKGEVG